MLIGLDTKFLNSLEESHKLILVVSNVIRKVLFLGLFPSLCRAKSLISS